MTHPLQTKDATLSPLLGAFKLDQIAFIARSDEDEMRIKTMLRLDQANWVEDIVIAKGVVHGENGIKENTAKLLFNYDMGIEIEILRYLEGPNYADLDGRYIKSCRPAHIGFHLEKGCTIPEGFKDWVFPANIIQQVETQSHTNQFLIDTGRRYRYTIYDTTPLFGMNLKVIERLGEGA